VFVSFLKFEGERTTFATVMPAECPNSNVGALAASTTRTTSDDDFGEEDMMIEYSLLLSLFLFREQQRRRREEFFVFLCGEVEDEFWFKFF
tara:strand:+ start:3512 stop:3784 length:273 start_codon:yes stop_codon:yes gene_type:complete